MALNTVVPSNTSVSSTARTPRICWQNLFTDPFAAVTPSSQAAGYEAANLWDGKEYTYWRPVGSGTHTILIDLVSSRSVDFLAVYGHTLNKVAGSVRLQYDATGSGSWVDCAPAISPTTSAPILSTFAPVFSNRFRLVVTCSGTVNIGIAAFGTSMRMERGCWTGSTPPWMGPAVEVVTTKSENGVLLGRSVKRLGVEFSMDFDFLSSDFVRDEWMPFITSTQAGPFFVQWNPAEYPDEVCFAWVDNPAKDIHAPKWTGPSVMSCGISCKGKV